MAWKRFAASGVVSTDPISLHTLVYYAANQAVTLKLYDGQSTAGVPVCTLWPDGKDSTKVVAFVPPLELASGLYVTLENGLEEVLVHFTRGIE